MPNSLRKISSTGKLQGLAACLLLAGLLTATSAPAAQLGQDSQPLVLSGDIPRPEAGPSTLEHRLWRLASVLREDGAAAARDFANTHGILLRDDRAVTLVQGVASGRARDLQSDSVDGGAEEAMFAAQAAVIARHVRNVGGQMRGRIGGQMEAEVPLRSLLELANYPEVGWIQATPRPDSLDTVSEGVQTTRANELQGSSVSYRPSGDPVRVGILDTGFFGYQLLLGTELPSTVVTRSFATRGLANGTDAHGTAVAEIVHDMAPDAELFFANSDTVLGHSLAVSWLIEQGVDVISNSVGWYNTGPGDGRGPINDDVRRATDAGIVWVVAAGNSGQSHWSGTFNDPDRDGWHNFSGAAETNPIVVQGGTSLIVSMNWDDWFQSNQDYDLYIFTDSNDVVDSSLNPQTGTQWPVEQAFASALVTATAHIAIRRFSASRPARFNVFFRNESSNGPRFNVRSGSITIPADTAEAVSVGATHWMTDQLEPFSSWGPTTDGRTKPNLVAPDFVSTVAFGPSGFPGTSASTPHVAGAIALMKSRFGIFSFDQIVDILTARAIPRGDQNRFGAGQLDVIGQ